MRLLVTLVYLVYLVYLVTIPPSNVRRKLVSCTQARLQPPSRHIIKIPRVALGSWLLTAPDPLTGPSIKCTRRTLAADAAGAEPTPEAAILKAIGTSVLTGAAVNCRTRSHRLCRRVSSVV